MTPPSGTVERWAWDYLRTRDLATKVSPPSAPAEWEADAITHNTRKKRTRPPQRLVMAPGRPVELRLVDRTRRSLPKSALLNPQRRAQLVHTFLHHELQAAELMCWAILAFPDTPRAFRRGLLRICQDELRHMQMYGEHIASLGFSVGDFPVRDWFWERVPRSRTPVHFVALMGMGLEGGNLDHARRFTTWFREIGDREGARIQARVLAEEVPHVRFATRWFRKWTGGLDFGTWIEHIAEPLTPTMLRGNEINEKDRLRAGFTASFLEELGRW